MLFKLLWTRCLQNCAIRRQTWRSRSKQVSKILPGTPRDAVRILEPRAPCGRTQAISRRPPHTAAFPCTGVLPRCEGNMQNRAPALTQDPALSAATQHQTRLTARSSVNLQPNHRAAQRVCEFFVSTGSPTARRKRARLPDALAPCGYGLASEVLVTLLGRRRFT